MNREIKFRAWDEGNKIMHTNFQWYKTGEESNDWIVFSSDQQKHKVESDALVFDNPYFSQQLKIMQYTGLLDKNGKEIYEGDIVKCFSYDNEIPKEYFSVWSVAYNTYLTSFCVGTAHNLTISFQRDIEVIGNIYQNKELLNQ